MGTDTEKARTGAAASVPVHKKSSHSGVKTLISALLAATVLIFLFIFVHDLNIRHKYGEAARLVTQGEYEQALDEFNALQHLHFHDTDAYISYCEARLAYERGGVYEAEADMIYAKFRYADEDELEDIEECRALVKDEARALDEKQP